MTIAPRLVPDQRSRVIQGGFFVVALAVWWLLTATHRVNAIFLPPPGQVLVQIGRILHSSTILVDAEYTFGTFALAYILATVCGLGIGYVVSASRFLMRVYEPLLASLYAVPIIVFFPTFILFFGTGPKSKLALGLVYAFFPIALNTISGFSQVDERLIVAARSMGANNGQLIWRVLLPGAMPVIATGMRIAFIACFASVLAGEMIASSHGLGHQIADAGQIMEIARMFGYVILVALATFVLNLAIGAVERRGLRQSVR